MGSCYGSQCSCQGISLLMLILAQLLNPCFKSTWLSFPVGDPEAPSARSSWPQKYLPALCWCCRAQSPAESRVCSAPCFQFPEARLSSFSFPPGKKYILNYIVKWVMHQNNASFLRKGLSVLGVWNVISTRHHLLLFLHGRDGRERWGPEIRF